MNINKKFQKVFVISYQRCGTTSVGTFLREQGFKEASWVESNQNKWSEKWAAGDFEGIINSQAFKDNEVFQDAPWFCPRFARFLAENVESSAFIHLVRPAEKWVRSMCRFNRGFSPPGDTWIHGMIYGRETDLTLRLESDKSPLSIAALKGEYEAKYDELNRVTKNYMEINYSDRYFWGELEDVNVFSEIAQFLEIDVVAPDVVHVNIGDANLDNKVSLKL